MKTLASENGWVNYWQQQNQCWIIPSSSCGNKPHIDEKNDLVTSQLACPVCHLSGHCAPGQIMASLEGIKDAECCLSECKMREGCLWFSFNQDQELCNLLRSCLSLKLGESWETGEVDCKMTPFSTLSSTIAAPTTSEPPSTPSTTDKEKILWIKGSDGAVRLGYNKSFKLDVDYSINLIRIA